MPIIIDKQINIDFFRYKNKIYILEMFSSIFYRYIIVKPNIMHIYTYGIYIFKFKYEQLLQFT